MYDCVSEPVQIIDSARQYGRLDTIHTKMFAYGQYVIYLRFQL